MKSKVPLDFPQPPARV